MSVLGIYNAGKEPIVFEPLGVKNQTPDATALHEEMHQHLTINTTFGFLHQLLESRASRGIHVKQCRRSMEEQWSVQELDATYAELFFVAVRYAGHLDEAIATLPSEILYQPPYREVFDSVAQYLPITIDMTEARLFAQHVFVHGVACWSFASDCLIHFRNPQDFTRGSFEAYLRQESPHHRFEHVMSRVLVDGVLEELVSTIESEVKPAISRGDIPETDPFTWLLPRLSVIARKRAILGGAQLLKQAKSIQKVWERHDGVSFLMDATERLPAMMVRPDVGLEAARTFEQKLSLNGEGLRQELEAARTAGLGVVLKLAVRDASSLAVAKDPGNENSTAFYFGTYLLGRGANPIEGGPVPPSFSPKDLFGVLPTEVLLRTLEAFPDLPHVLAFWGPSSWRAWQNIAGDRSIARKSVWVYMESLNVSVEAVQELLAFQDLGSEARYFVAGYKPDRPQCVFFVNPSRPDVLAMLLTPTESAARAFRDIAERLGLEALSNPRQLEHFPLTHLLSILLFDIKEP